MCYLKTILIFKGFSNLFDFILSPFIFKMINKSLCDEVVNPTYKLGIKRL